YQMLVDEADDEGGYLYAEILSEREAEQQYITQILLKHLFYSLEDVAQTYPDYVTIKMQ
ncbi:MAG TPA: ribosomal-processing cysteine protease Prp, partial [Trichococcus sp.]|nr:ribosomal-processing cysteine protease Prp [Trichococcus sp.]